MAGGRKSKTTAIARPQTSLVLDNGAYSLKAGFVDSINGPRIIPNCIARDRARKIYVGSDLEKCRDFGEMQFRRPVEKGFIVGWEAQKEIWDHELFDDQAPLHCDPTETRLVLAEPPNGLPALQSNCDQIVFEEYGFASYYRGTGAAFNAYLDIQSLFTPNLPIVKATEAPAEIIMVIDSGYSHTTVTPLFNGRPLQSAVRRLDVGGKVLTNFLTRLISTRHFDVRNDTYIVNEMKEAACFVSADFKADLEKTWKGTRGQRRDKSLAGAAIAKDYVLPDFHTRSRGQLRDHDAERHSRAHKLAATITAEEDVLTLRNERFAVPELLFTPSDVGIHQPGIADLVRQSLQSLPVGLWPGLLANIVVVGGNTLFHGFVDRLRDEVVQRMPDECNVRVARPNDPIVSTWTGAVAMASHANMEQLAVSKQDYDEMGAALVSRKLATGLSVVP
ncbi:hypothetical protein CDD81_4553 [Ophiocordyceps australis]|uniref:Actin-like protein ARP6 n=1 Tax=Ophiocordyceps australis TaxID=1399860 RepID=A0A2C5XJ37_9HYPO|nr:hypothetical protein CDD81_4553 [Ophiocordyceps australis]